MEGTVLALLLASLACFAGYTQAEIALKPSAEVTAEKQLYNDLLEGYNKNIRPVRNSSDATSIKFGMALIQLIEMNEISEYIEMAVWFRLMWRDSFLTWDPAKYDGVSKIRIPFDKIWKPDTLLYNSLSTAGLAEMERILPIVYSDGSVLWIPPTRIKASCDMYLEDFPADKQVCVFKFGSWTHDGFSLDLDFYEGQTEIDVSDYNPHHSWKLLGSEGTRNVKIYPCCPEPYIDLTYRLKLERGTSFLNIWLVRPFVALALFLPFVFIFPGELKSVVATGLLISMTLMLVLVQDDIPPISGTIPSIVYHYSGLYLCIMLALLLSGISNNLVARGRRGAPVPKLIKKILVDILGRVVCVHSKPYSMLASPVTMSSVDTHDSGVSDNDNHQILSRNSVSSSIVTHPNEWELVARVIDRVSMIVYLVIMVIFAIVTMAKYE